MVVEQRGLSEREGVIGIIEQVECLIVVEKGVALVHICPLSCMLSYYILA